MTTLFVGALDANEGRGAELSPWMGGAKPPFSLDALDGDGVALAAYGGRIVLVHFFATWCEPCRAEMSALQRLAERYAREGVTILAIDVGELDFRVRRFFDSAPVSFPILLDRNKEVTKAWGITTLPMTFLLDRALALRFVVEGEFDWDRSDADHKLNALASAEPASHDRQSDASSKNLMGGIK